MKTFITSQQFYIRFSASHSCSWNTVNYMWLVSLMPHFWLWSCQLLSSVSKCVCCWNVKTTWKLWVVGANTSSSCAQFLPAGPVLMRSVGRLLIGRVELLRYARAWLPTGLVLLVRHSASNADKLCFRAIKRRHFKVPLSVTDTEEKLNVWHAEQVQTGEGSWPRSPKMLQYIQQALNKPKDSKGLNERKCDAFVKVGNKPLLKGF